VCGDRISYQRLRLSDSWPNLGEQPDGPSGSDVANPGVGTLKWQVYHCVRMVESALRLTCCTKGGPHWISLGKSRLAKTSLLKSVCRHSGRSAAEVGWPRRLRRGRSRSRSEEILGFRPSISRGTKVKAAHPQGRTLDIGLSVDRPAENLIDDGIFRALIGGAHRPGIDNLIWTVKSGAKRKQRTETVVGPDQKIRICG
jgi:hypothetical protein